MRAQILAIAILVVGSGVAAAQKTCDPDKDKDCRAPRTVAKQPKQPKAPPVYTIDPMTVGGKVRGAMMLQFLERANEELERASLQRRSFVPELVRSVELEAL